jgi:hypothetical protein
LPRNSRRSLPAAQARWVLHPELREDLHRGRHREGRRKLLRELHQARRPFIANSPPTGPGPPPRKATEAIAHDRAMARGRARTGGRTPANRAPRRLVRRQQPEAALTPLQPRAWAALRKEASNHRLSHPQQRDMRASTRSSRRPNPAQLSRLPRSCQTKPTLPSEVLRPHRPTPRRPLCPDRPPHRDSVRPPLSLRLLRPPRFRATSPTQSRVLRPRSYRALRPRPPPRTLLLMSLRLLPRLLLLRCRLYPRPLLLRRLYPPPPRLPSYPHPPPRSCWHPLQRLLLLQHRHQLSCLHRLPVPPLRLWGRRVSSPRAPQATRLSQTLPPRKTARKPKGPRPQAPHRRARARRQTSWQHARMAPPRRPSRAEPGTRRARAICVPMAPRQMPAKKTRAAQTERAPAPQAPRQTPPEHHPRIYSPPPAPRWLRVRTMLSPQPSRACRHRRRARPRNPPRTQVP